MAAVTTLTCPKCHGEMRSYERNGVTVDQCGDCRGIFLDRGELERLIDAEQRWSAQAGAPPREPDRRHVPPPSSPRQDPRYDPRNDPRYDPRRDQRPGHKKRKHWLEELFD